MSKMCPNCNSPLQTCLKPINYFDPLIVDASKNKDGRRLYLLGLSADDFFLFPGLYGQIETWASVLCD